MSLIATATFYSLAAGLATGVGALGIFCIKRLSDRMEDGLLSFAAGVMLAASFFSLIIPGLDIAVKNGETEIMAALIAVGGVLLGAFTVWGLNEILPHDHFLSGHEGPATPKLRKIWLFIIAITIHNFPEGMAVGVGFGGGDMTNGRMLATGIGLQNFPEGLAVAMALMSEKYPRGKAFFIALLTGLVEPIGGFLGIAAVSIFTPLLPWGLTFAAGAMLFIISHEIIPETHNRSYKNTASVGFLIGMCLMMYLDITLG